MFRMLRSGMRNSVPQRLRFHEKPENNYDFVRYPYGNSPVKVVGFWKIYHNYDFGPEQLDYEDHSMTMLHQRPTHFRSFWVVFMAVASWCWLYFVWVEMPFPGIMLGQSSMNVKLNGIKYLNDDENYHNWDSLLKKFETNLALQKAAEEAEEEGESSGDAPESDLVEVEAEASE